MFSQSMAETINVGTSGKRKNATLSGEYYCVLYFSELAERETQNVITPERWLRIKTQSEKWKDHWDGGSSKKYTYKSCELDLFDERKLGQALKRRENVLSEQEQQELPQTEYNETIVQPKGKLHDKNLMLEIGKCQKKEKT